MDQPAPVDPTKCCCTCKQVKPLTDFNRLTRSADGRQPSCRECNRAYHQANWDRHMAQIRRRKRERVAENCRLLVERLSESTCADCGEADIIVLDFDHLRDKTASVSAMVFEGHSWGRIEEEIAKCEVVCANCHRRRTAARANSFRHRAVHGDG